MISANDLMKRRHRATCKEEKNKNECLHQKGKCKIIIVMFDFKLKIFFQRHSTHIMSTLNCDFISLCTEFTYHICTTRLGTWKQTQPRRFRLYKKLRNNQQVPTTLKRQRAKVCALCQDLLQHSTLAIL